MKNNNKGRDIQWLYVRHVYVLSYASVLNRK